MYFKNENEYFKSIIGICIIKVVMGWGLSLYILGFIIYFVYFLVFVELI